MRSGVPGDACGVGGPDVSLGASDSAPKAVPVRSTSSSASTGRVGVRGAGGGDGIPKEGLLGSGTMPCVFAEAGMEHAKEYGTTFEQFAKISVKNHHHSTMNPKAMYQIETPLDVVMNAEMISYPNT